MNERADRYYLSQPMFSFTPMEFDILIIGNHFIGKPVFQPVGVLIAPHKMFWMSRSKVLQMNLFFFS